MIEQWILDKIEPLKPAPLIILRDPQRMIQAGAHVVDGWAEKNGYTVLFCAGNLALREMYEAIRNDSDARVLLVDRSRESARIPLFYPDLAAQAEPHGQMALSLHDFLVEKTGDLNWPHLVNDRLLSRRILDHLPGTLRVHQQLRQLSGSRFSDTDLYKIVLGATLQINPFRKPSAACASSSITPWMSSTTSFRLRSWKRSARPSPVLPGHSAGCWSATPGWSSVLSRSRPSCTSTV